MTSPGDERGSLRPRRSWRLALTCLSIALNAVTAGGIFTFPLLSPALATHLRLSQPQLTTIVLAGMAGQYPFASLVGSVIDSAGPWACSLAASALFAAGFGLFSLQVRACPDTDAAAAAPCTPAAFYRLVFFFFLAGLGTVCSYFSALFCASKNFPRFSGLASGTSMALFGLSPLALSLCASSALFTDAATGALDVARFTAFLAALTALVNAGGAAVLRVEPQDPPHAEPDLNSETAPLLPRTVPRYDRVWDVLRDAHFWILIFFVACTLSSCEMVISNIGTISLALPARPATRSLAAAALADTAVATTQVRLLSLSNTVSRVVTGAAADYISPAGAGASAALALPRPHRVSRVAFLCASSVLLALAFLYMVFAAHTQDHVWLFSIAIGTAYGTIFTVAPSVVSSIWGIENLARNFGLLTYAPFVGTPLFSYLYAFLSSAAAEGTPDGVVCTGKRCWARTFYVCAAAAALATGLAGLLWRRWRGKV